MIFPTKANWQEWGISHEAHKFFLLRWQEIFDEETFDSWQVRSSNTRTILKEILEATRVVEKVHVYHPNIKALIDEAIQTAKNDNIISESFPFVFDYLKKLNTAYETKVKNQEKQDIESFRRLILVILGNSDKYREKLFNRFKELISNPPDQYKTKLYSLTIALGIELKSIGYSISSLRDSFQILIDSSEPDFIKRFEKLIKKYSGKSHKYECQFLVSWPGDFPNLGRYNIELLKQRPNILLSEEEKKFFDQDIQATIALVKVSAFDIFSARYLAEEKLSSLFAVSKLYQVSKTPTIKHPLSLVKLGTGFVKCIGPDISRLKYIRDAKQPLKSIADFAKLLSNLSSSDAGQLTASLQYHKLSLLAPTDEARLVNLWIALESLVQEGGKSIINRICTYVPTSNTTVYISQIMLALPIDIRKLWRASNTKSLQSLLVHSSEHILHPSDMLAILLDDEKGNLINEFLKFSSEHPLLIFRIYRLWNNLLGSPKILSDMLEKHKKNIEWQIRRIYRVRNNIMHQGSYPFETRQLIQHLHSYFIITIHNFVHDLRTNPTWSICDAFEHRLLMYEHFQKRVKEYNNNPISAESLLDFSLTLSTKSCQPAWPISRYPINLPCS